MAENEQIKLDKYSTPIFDPSLLNEISITRGHNTLNTPDNLDRITVELLDEYSNIVQTEIKHITDLEGIMYSAGHLKVDTFAVLTKLFSKTSGRYTIKISGHRNYIYNDISIEDINNPEEEVAVEYTDVAPSNILLSGLTVIEVSKSRKEIRVRATKQNETAFNNFQRHQSPTSVPISGKYWRWHVDGTVPGNPFYYSTDGQYNKDTATVLMMNADFYAHREALGLPFGDDNMDRWNGVSRRDSNLNHVKWLSESPAGRRLDSTRDIWPVELRLIKPDGGQVILSSTNWMEHDYEPEQVEGEESPDSISTIIFKLPSAAPTGLTAGLTLQVRRSLFVPYEIPVEIDIPFILDELYEQLRGPNLRLDINKNLSKSTTVKNKTDLLGTTDSISSRLTSGIVTGSETITVNSDYRQLKRD